MESIPQLGEALAVIDNVCKISNNAWWNRAQCKRIADRFSAVSEALKDLSERNLVCSESSNGGRYEQYPAFDKLLAVLHKGETLVSSWNTWKGFGSIFGLLDTRDAMYKEVHEELDTMKALFHFEESVTVGHEQDSDSDSGLKTTHKAMEKLPEMEETARYPRPVAGSQKSQQTIGIDMKMVGLDIIMSMDMVKLDIKPKVTEGLSMVKRACGSIGERADSELVYKTTRIGLPCATLAAWQQELDFLNKLCNHPHTVGVLAGSNEQSSIVMDYVSDTYMQELVDSQKWRAVPVSRVSVTLPLNFYCEVLDTLLQAGIRMAYLHSKRVIHRDLKSRNVYITNKHPGPNRVDVELKVSGSGNWHGVYECSGVGFQSSRAQEMEVIECLILGDVFGFGITCKEVVTIRVPFTDTLPCDNLQGNSLNALCEENMRGNDHVKSCLQRECLLSKVLNDFDSDVDVGTECMNLEDFDVSANKIGDLPAVEILDRCQKYSTTYMNAALPEEVVHVDGAREHHRQIADYEKLVNVDVKLVEEPPTAQLLSKVCSLAPTNDVGSCATYGAILDFQSVAQQHSAEVPENPLDGEPAKKRNRTRIWSDDEKLALLKLTKEAPTVDEEPDWDQVSDNLWEEYDYDRASFSCQQQWFTLLQSYRAIQDHESKVQNCVSDCVSYWDMSEGERSKNKLQQTFDFKWCEMIELTASTSLVQDPDFPASTLPLCQLQSSAIYMDHFGSANCNEVLGDEWKDDKSEEIGTEESEEIGNDEDEDERLSVDSSATVEAQAEATADSANTSQAQQRYEPCYETTSGHRIKGEDRTKRFCETNSKNAGKNGAGEDDIILRIAPFVNKQIEIAVKPLLAVLRSREELNHPKKLTRRAGEAGSKAEENAIY